MNSTRSPSSSSTSSRRHTAIVGATAAAAAEGELPPPTTANLPRLAASAAAFSTAPTAAQPRSPGATHTTSLLPLAPRRSAGTVEASPPPRPPSVFATYPLPVARTAGDNEEFGGTAPPLRPSAESMELAVVPFTGGSLQVRPRSSGHAHTTAHSDSGSEGGDGEDGDVYGVRAAGLGALAPTTISTERVCPHCLRPYDLYDDDDLYEPSGVFYRGGDGAAAAAAANTPRQLPAPPALPAPASARQQQQEATYLVGPPSQTSGAFSSSKGGDGAASSAVGRGGGGASTATSPRGTHTRGQGLVHERGGSAFPPPAIAFTAHYFRALPPPAILAAAAAEGTSPLAIEDYNGPGLGDNSALGVQGSGSQESAEEGPTYAAVLPCGPQGRSLGMGSGALVLAGNFAGGQLPLRATPGSPLKLMQSEDEEEEADKTRAPLSGRAGDQGSMRDMVLDEEDVSAHRASSPTQSVYSPNAPGPAPNNGYYHHYFKELCLLGRGTFGGVYLCRHLMCGVNLGDFALKKIPVGEKAGYLQSVLREVRILEEVRRHPNVVEYKHSWVEDAQLADFGPPVRCLFILMEYASAGSIDAYLDKYGTTLSTLAVWYFFLSAVAGTAHLHHKHILHRDLKPQNLLLAESKGRPPRVLVSDFGTAALLDDVSYERSGGTGTLEYMAPELFETVASPRSSNEHYVNRHTMASDVWSLGVTLYFLAFDATLPDRREDGSVVLNTPRLASYGRPPEMLQLLEAMLQRDPALRPRCSDVLASARVQAILRTFNQEDWTQWDMQVDQQQQQQQQQVRGRKGVGVKTPSPPQSSLPLRASPGGRSVEDRSLSPALAQSRHAITVTSSTGPAMQLRRRERPTASADSGTGSEADVLSSSRVVELQSTTALMDLSSATRPASGVAVVGDEHPQLQGRGGRPVTRFSSALEGHERPPAPPRGSAGRRPRSPQTGSVSTPVVTPPPPPQTVDAGVQTDPVRFTDA